MFHSLLEELYWLTFWGILWEKELQTYLLEVKKSNKKLSALFCNSLTFNQLYSMTTTYLNFLLRITLLKNTSSSVSLSRFFFLWEASGQIRTLMWGKISYEKNRKLVVLSYSKRHPISWRLRAFITKLKKVLVLGEPTCFLEVASVIPKSIKFD